MAVNLTPGAISKIVTGKCTSNDVYKPVLQVIYIHSSLTRTIDNKQWCVVKLSDGSFWQHGCIPFEIFISNKLQIGSIVQLTMFQLTKLFRKSGIILGFDLTVIHSKCGIISDPKLYHLPLVERTTPTIPHEDHANSHLNENIDSRHHIKEPPISHSPTQNKRMDVNLTSEAISKIVTGECTENDLKPVLQLIYINIFDSRLTHTINGKQWYGGALSDGSFSQVAFVADEMTRSKQLQKGSIVQLTKFRLFKGRNSMGEMRSGILVSDLTVIHSKCGIIGDPKLFPVNETLLVERTAPTIPDEDQIHANSHHVEEPPTSMQNPSTSTQKCSSHSITQNNTDTVTGVNLTPGAITKIMTDKCSSNDLKPVVQVTNILSDRICTKDNKQCYRKFVLSDGSSSHFGCIDDDIFISNKLQKGSIVQLTKFQFTKFSTYGNIRVVLINDLNVIHSVCNLIGNPEPFPRNDTPLVERSTPPIPDEEHVNVSQAQKSVTLTQKCSEIQSRKRKHQSSYETPESDTNEDVDNNHNAQEPLATTQKCSSYSPTQSKKRKHQSSNDNISKVVEDVSKMTKMVMEKNKQDDIGACFKKLETLEEDVSKMARMMIEKNKEDDVSACFKKLETLEKDISKVTRMMMEKNKEDFVGFKKLGTPEEDVFKMMRMIMEKNKEDDVRACFKKLETLEEDVSKLTRMMMEKNKEDDMGACIEKLDKMGWGSEEPIYDTALLLFGQSADYRKLWLHLKPESCGKWVKNAGSMFGLLN